MQKRILMLGGSYFQVPAIKYVKSRGYHVITCDYLPDNPGHRYADEYYNVSTTDMDGVLELARRLNIDGIIAYASDPAAPTAAYVGNYLGLPSHPYESVNILTNKDLYRDFLRNNGFNSPLSRGFTSLSEAKKYFPDFRHQVMVKPVDSSGSKGVSKISTIKELPEAFNRAREFSRSGRVVVEEHVERIGPQMHGDGFVHNGELLFAYFGDHYYDKTVNPFVPVSTIFPSLFSEKIKKDSIREVQKIVTLLKLCSGAINIEIMIDSAENIFVMEIGPRNGGNFVPQITRYATGIDFVKMTVDAAIGGVVDCPKFNPDSRFYSYYAIHSKSGGRLDSIQIDESLKQNILEKHVFCKPGDIIKAFHGSNATLGILLLKFDSEEKMSYVYKNIEKYIRINIS